MNPLLLWGLLAVSTLVLSGVVYALGIRTGYGLASTPTDEEQARRTVREVQARGESAARLTTTESGDTLWVGPEDDRTKAAAEAIRKDSSGVSITGTWTEFSDGEATVTTVEGDGPPGFPGEDMDDEDVEEWLREWGLSGYD